MSATSTSEVSPAMPPKQEAASVAVPLTLLVCTRNRLRQLRASMDCILGLRCSVPWQLVVVDNGSTDGSWEYLNSLSSRAGMDLECVRETRRGLSHARNAGLRQARGEIVALTDDDCYPTASFLDDVLEVFSQAGVDYCGGRVILHDPADLPVSTQTAPESTHFPARSFIAPGAICGANMAFRRRLLEVVGSFDVRLGAGTAIGSAEDTDYLRWRSNRTLHGELVVLRAKALRKCSQQLELCTFPKVNPRQFRFPFEDPAI